MLRYLVSTALKLVIIIIITIVTSICSYPKSAVPHILHRSLHVFVTCFHPHPRSRLPNPITPHALCSLGILSYISTITHLRLDNACSHYQANNRNYQDSSLVEYMYASRFGNQGGGISSLYSGASEKGIAEVLLLKDSGHSSSFYFFASFSLTRLLRVVASGVNGWKEMYYPFQLSIYMNECVKLDECCCFPVHVHNMYPPTLHGALSIHRALPNLSVVSRPFFFFPVWDCMSNQPLIT